MSSLMLWTFILHAHCVCHLKNSVHIPSYSFDFSSSWILPLIPVRLIRCTSDVSPCSSRIFPSASAFSLTTSHFPSSHPTSVTFAQLAGWLGTEVSRLLLKIPGHNRRLPALTGSPHGNRQHRRTATATRWRWREKAGPHLWSSRDRCAPVRMGGQPVKKPLTGRTIGLRAQRRRSRLTEDLCPHLD